MAYWTDDLGGRSIRQKLHFEDHGKHNSVIESVQDCTPVIEENKRFLAQREGRKSAHGTSVAARIPHIHYYIIWPQEYEAKHGYHPRRPPPHIDRKEAELNWRNFIMRKLNDADFRDFRTDNPHKKLDVTGKHGSMF